MSPRRLSRRPLDETRLARRDRRAIATNRMQRADLSAATIQHIWRPGFQGGKDMATVWMEKGESYSRFGVK